MLRPIAVPERTERMLDGALVWELTVISRGGRPTHIQIVWVEVHECGT